MGTKSVLSPLLYKYAPWSSGFYPQVPSILSLCDIEIWQDRDSRRHTRRVPHWSDGNRNSRECGFPESVLKDEDECPDDFSCHPTATSERSVTRRCEVIAGNAKSVYTKRPFTRREESSVKDYSAWLPNWKTTTVLLWSALANGGHLLSFALGNRG